MSQMQIQPRDGSSSLPTNSTLLWVPGHPSSPPPVPYIPSLLASGGHWHSRAQRPVQHHLHPGTSGHIPSWTEGAERCICGAACPTWGPRMRLPKPRLPPSGGLWWNRHPSHGDFGPCLLGPYTCPLRCPRSEASLVPEPSRLPPWSSCRVTACSSGHGP